MPGVGTNRYAYAGNDLVNKLDPGGNFFGFAFGRNGGQPDDGLRSSDSYDNYFSFDHHLRRNNIDPTEEFDNTALLTVAGDVSGLNGAYSAVIAAAQGDLTGVATGAAEVALGKVKVLSGVANSVGGVVAEVVSGISRQTKGAKATKNRANGQTGFSGSRGNPLKNPIFQPSRNTPAVIDDRTFTGHALDEMQNCGIPLSVAGDAISPSNLVGAGNRPGTSVYYSGINGVRVITNSNGDVMTEITAPRQ